MITHKHLKEIGFYKRGNVWELGCRFIIIAGILSDLVSKRCWELEEVGYWYLISIIKPKKKNVELPKPKESYTDENGTFHIFMNIGLITSLIGNESSIYTFSKIP
jgi:hypothetical protein